MAASPSACADELLDALPPVMRFVRRHMHSHRGRRLSVPQFRALAMLRTSPEANLSAVADFLGASRPTTSRLISHLVGLGFVRRCVCASDRRHVELVLTPSGQKATANAWRVTRARLAERLAGLDARERSDVVAGMRALHSTFTAAARS